MLLYEWVFLQVSILSLYLGQPYLNRLVSLSGFASVPLLMPGLVELLIVLKAEDVWPVNWHNAYAWSKVHQLWAIWGLKMCLHLNFVVLLSCVRRGWIMRGAWLCRDVRVTNMAEEQWTDYSGSTYTCFYTFLNFKYPPPFVRRSWRTALEPHTREWYSDTVRTGWMHRRTFFFGPEPTECIKTSK